MTQTDLLSLRCSGSVSQDSNTVACGFVVTIVANGAVHIEFEPLAYSQHTSWLYRVWSARSAEAPLEIQGATVEGRHVSSNSLYMSEVKLKTQPGLAATLSIRASVLGLEIRDPGLELGTYDFVVRYRLSGLRIRGQLSGKGPTGEEWIACGTGDRHQLGSVLEVRKSLAAKPEFATWIDAIDDKASDVLSLLSLASGLQLRGSIKEVFWGERLWFIECRECWEPARPYQAPFHYLELSSFFEYALQSPPLQASGLNVALSWHLLDTPFEEVRLIAQMTALEHLIHVLSTQTAGRARLLDKGLFCEIKTEVAAVIDSAAARHPSSGHALSILKNKFDASNTLTLREAMEALCTHYRVPVDDLCGEFRGLIDCRNDVVHRGLHRDYDRLGEHLSIAIELLRRIAFAVVGFEGRYRTWLKGCEHVEFRPSGGEPSPSVSSD